MRRIGVSVATAALVLTAAACDGTASHPAAQAPPSTATADCPQYTTCPPLTSAERKAAASAAAANQKSNTASSTPTAAASPTPDTELTVCVRFDKRVFPGIAATLFHAVGTGTPNPPYSKAEARLLRDDLELSRWSYLVRSQAGDAAFANYLGDAGTALGVVAAPFSTAAQAQTAARDVGTVNGYCKYDAS